ncbi:hypothetical protein [Rasiella sp. SM2506]|uniref:hypothetical protein n=1 Tax=Rasiella sp. SM2506 TaxID=3423914 RepID=UPI003D79689F
MKWLLLFLSCFCLSGCSYLTDFYIFNTSEELITISYKTKKTEAYHPFVTAPKIASFKNLKNVGKKETTQVAIEIKDSLNIMVTLQPKQALWIGVDRNFILKNDRQQLEENLDYLTITQGQKIIKYSAKDIASQFDEFTYKIVGIAVE